MRRCSRSCCCSRLAGHTAQIREHGVVWAHAHRCAAARPGAQRTCGVRSVACPCDARSHCCPSQALPRRCYPCSRWEAARCAASTGARSVLLPAGRAAAAAPRCSLAAAGGAAAQLGERWGRDDGPRLKLARGLERGERLVTHLQQPPHRILHLPQLLPLCPRALHLSHQLVLLLCCLTSRLLQQCGREAHRRSKQGARRRAPLPSASPASSLTVTYVTFLRCR